MPRTARHSLVAPGLPHHLILRGNNRRNLFAGVHDRAQLIRYALTSPHVARCEVHAVALMTNHVHLVVTPDTFDGLWRWVKSIAQRYAIHRNSGLGGTGKVFEQRYGLVAIRTERQLAATTAYVDLNPTRVGRTSCWSTLGVHGGLGQTAVLVRELWRPSSWWLALGQHDHERRAAYRELVTRRWEAWQADVALPGGSVPPPVARTDRPRRPDGTHVADGVPGYGFVAAARQNAIVPGGLRGRE